MQVRQRLVDALNQANNTRFGVGCQEGVPGRLDGKDWRIQEAR